MAGNFHGGQVKFDKYNPGWQALSPKSLADLCYGQVKRHFWARNFSKLPARLASARKSKDLALLHGNWKEHAC